MKGGFYGLRGKQLSLILIAFACTSIIIWGWDKTPLLTSLLPPQGQPLQFSPEIQIDSPVVSSMHKDVSAPAEEVTVDVKETLHFNVAAPFTPPKSSPEISTADSDLRITPVLKEEIPTNVTEEAKQKQREKSSKKSKHGLGIVAPMTSANTSSSVRVKDHNEVITLAENQVCNYAKGKWVVDNSRPLYSGFGCKQWLSGMWACRLTQRTDFAYEKLRWQPKDCKMEEFKASKFLDRMQHKTLAFIGDSLGRQQFQSLMCMVTEGKSRPDVEDVGKKYGLVKAKGAIRPDGWAYRFPTTNTTILYYWSASLCDLEPLDPNNKLTDYAMHLDRPPYFLRRYLPNFDVVVLNTGHHWNRGKLKANRWVMHVGGVPNTNRKIAEIGGAKNFTIYSIVNWVNSQLPNYPGLKAFYRTISPRHFFNGDWNTGGSCDNTDPPEGKEVLGEESIDSVAAGAVNGTRVKLLDITAPSQIRDEGHISKYSIKATTPGVQDCLHWCLPGVPDTWNEFLFAQL